VTIRRLAVVGTGLMGASVGLAAKRAGIEVVAGFDADRSALEAAVARGAVDVPAHVLADAVMDTDLVVVATPVGAVSEVTRAVAELVDERCAITDLGSTKRRICSELAGVAAFLGGHPMCGSETSGPERARADLFDDATWFLTPLPDSDPSRLEVVTTFAASLGARPLVVEPEAHDRLLALVSHLPHALANLLVAQVSEAEADRLDPLTLAGTSFRDLTRVAGANPGIWAGIFLDNRELLADALAELRGRMEDLEAALRAGDDGAVLSSIEEAAARRRQLAARERRDP
jgi:prephenate dehydrogenase